MVKFTKGMWHLGPDIIVNWAVEAVKTEANKDSIRCVAVCRYGQVGFQPFTYLFADYEAR